MQAKSFKKSLKRMRLVIDLTIMVFFHNNNNIFKYNMLNDIYRFWEMKVEEKSMIRGDRLVI